MASNNLENRILSAFTALTFQGAPVLRQACDEPLKKVRRVVWHICCVTPYPLSIQAHGCSERRQEFAITHPITQPPWRDDIQVFSLHEIQPFHSSPHSRRSAHPAQLPFAWRLCLAIARTHLQKVPRSAAASRAHSPRPPACSAPPPRLLRWQLPARHPPVSAAWRRCRRRLLPF